MVKILILMSSGPVLGGQSLNIGNKKLALQALEHLENIF